MNFQTLKKLKDKYGSVCIGTVLRILDNRTLVVSANKHDLKLGQIIQVYEPLEMLIDSDGSELSRYYYIKDELEVISTEENYSVCKKMEKVEKKITFPVSPILEQVKTEYVPLNIDKEDIQELKPTEPLVKVGNPIKLA